MKMQKRTNLVTQFSSFLYTKDESDYLITYWKNIPELERNIQLLLKQQIIIPPEDVLASEFLKNLKAEYDKFKYRHLIAYLQESCFFATQTVYQRLKNYWDLFTWQDYFQWANLLVSSPVQLLSNYDEQFSFKLTTYTRNKLENQLIDQAYKYMGWERSSDWGLLRKLSVNNQQKCLKNIGGLTDNNLTKYLLVWSCFNVVYNSKGLGTNKKLNSPSDNHFLAVSNEYNFIAKNKINNLPILQPKDCENILLDCVSFARQFCNPRLINNVEYLNNLKDSIELDQEEKSEQELVNDILTSTFEELETPQKILFQLWKGLGFTQTEIVEVMMVNYSNFVTAQFQVAREISFVRQVLLEKLIKQLLLEQNNLLTKEKLKQLKQPLDSWLQNYCHQIFWAKIEQIYLSLPLEIKNDFRQKVKDNNGIIHYDPDEEITCSIVLEFIAQIIKEYNIQISLSKNIKISILKIIEEWINNSLHTLIN